MAAVASVSVTREELKTLKNALKHAAEGSDGEAAGDKEVDARATRACELLAAFVEEGSEREADVLVALEAVPVLVEVVLEANSRRMMESLMGAVAGCIPERKVHSLRCLVEIASLDRHRGPIAGSGLLGLVSAIVVQPKTPASLRALAFRAVGVLVAHDEHEPDARRAEEFTKLRQQVLAVKGVEIMSGCLVPTRSQEGVSLCASAAQCLAAICGDPAARAGMMRKGGAIENAVSLLKEANDAREDTDSDGEAEDLRGIEADAALDSLEAATFSRRPALRLLSRFFGVILRPPREPSEAIDSDIEYVARIAGDGMCSRLAEELGRFLAAGGAPSNSEEECLALSIMALLCKAVNITGDPAKPPSPLVDGVSLLAVANADIGTGVAQTAAEDGGSLATGAVTVARVDWVATMRRILTLGPSCSAIELMAILCRDGGSHDLRLLRESNTTSWRASALANGIVRAIVASVVDQCAQSGSSLSSSPSPQLLRAALAALSTFSSVQTLNNNNGVATLYDVVGAVSRMLVANRNLVRCEAIACVGALARLPGCCLDHDARLSEVKRGAAGVTGRKRTATIMEGLRTAVSSLDLPVDARESALATQAKLDEALRAQVGRKEGGEYVTCDSIFQSDVKSAAAEYASDPEQLKVIGNECFGQRILVDAVAYYDAALTAIGDGTTSNNDELRAACELNKARAFLKLQDEEACLAACRRAEVTSPQKSAFVRAQLSWLLSGASDQWEGPAVPRAERKARLTEAKAILRSVSGEGGDRSKAVLILLRSVQDALKH